MEHRNEAAAEADWQTVTTEQAHGFFDDALAHSSEGIRTSFADIANESEYHVCQCDASSVDRIIQHPVHDEDPRSYHLRNDKQTKRPVLVPKFREPGPTGFLQNASRSTPRKVMRAASAIRRVSNPFRIDAAGDRFCRSNIFEMDTLRHSFESLDSQPPESLRAFSHHDMAKKGDKFSWSRIQQNLGREPPKHALTVFDQPLYRPGIQEAARSPTRDYIPHDVFLSDIPQLPFPLISLPEAAMLQHFRRERGEEDDTEPSGSFISRTRRGTVSTVASTYRPGTPGIYHHDSFDAVVPPLPPPLPCFDGPRRRTFDDSMTDGPTHSSGIFRTPHSSQGTSLPNSSWYRTMGYDSTSLLGDGAPRHHTMSGLRGRRPKMQPMMIEEPGYFGPSQVDLISAREDILFRRDMDEIHDRRQRKVFILVLFLAIPFPFIGVLALWRMFDSTVSWYTYGMRHRLTYEQRVMLKYQLAVEVVLYPVLVIVLTVVFSKH
ncbi:hypothetical protein NLU13_8210 [Sarocladium strictum]|uniref:Uncharacterized protein n=1 Tax=Sarocladium strictum TaxID=5046 RepID=A0AA39L4F1_SARSR|nr:hypothetical protein NLU13_8210 [Sarocladium strictum]